MSAKKKLLMITCDGGIAYGKQNVFYEMLKDFSPHFERVDIICPSNEKGKEIKIHENVYLHPSPYSKRFHADVFRHKNFIVKKGMEIFRKSGFDLIDAHFLPPLMSQVRGGLALAHLTQKPLLAEFMHLPGLPKASGYKEWMEKEISLFFLKRYQKKIAHFRIINEGEIGRLFKKKLHFREKQLHFISSIYLDFAYFKPLTLSRELGWFVVAGRLAQNKGLPLIIEAVDLVKKRGYHSVKLKIVGDGELRRGLEKLIEKKGLKKEVELLGWLPTQADVAQLYNQAQASIMASFNEGGPRVVFESMACGTPVLTSRVGESQEVIRDGENGFFIQWDAEDIAEKIIWAIENPEELRKLGERARETVQPWQKKKILKRYAEELYNIIDDSSRHS